MKNGYVMVPVEPSRNMFEVLDEEGDRVAEAGEYYFKDLAAFEGHMRRIYKAMIKAAPPHPACPAHQCALCGSGLEGPSAALPPYHIHTNLEHVPVTYSNNTSWPAIPAAQPAPDVAALVESLLDRIVPRIDAGMPNPIEPDEHHCEYTLYQERERIHAEFSDVLAQIKKDQPHD